LGGLIYAGGAGIYALKFPERYFKKRFDIIGASH
jgi:predicted membrane channel-forming protein YqfA (hemolysin III family)